jgi:hypothetical protein
MIASEMHLWSSSKDSLKPQSDSALACAISGLVYLVNRLDKAAKKRL